MLSPTKIKWLKSLSIKKFRRQEGLFVAEGEKIVNELLQSPWNVTEIFALDSWHYDKKGNNSIPIHLISPKDLERISSLSTPNKVLAVVRMKEFQFHQMILKNQFTLFLENIQDPGNLGTIIRTAEWFGIHNIVCSPESADIYNQKVIQSTMGSFIRTNLVYMPFEVFLDGLPEGFPVMGAMLTGDNIFNIKLPKEGVLVIGNESKGISDETGRYITNKIFIPRGNHNQKLPESLNASVATAIILAQLRQ
jgi:RNA methyltransferase, TrmH family